MFAVRTFERIPGITSMKSLQQCLGSLFYGMQEGSIQTKPLDSSSTKLQSHWVKDVLSSVYRDSGSGFPYMSGSKRMQEAGIIVCDVENVAMLTNSLIEGQFSDLTLVRNNRESLMSVITSISCNRQLLGKRLWHISSGLSHLAYGWPRKGENTAKTREFCLGKQRYKDRQTVSSLLAFQMRTKW